MPPRRGSLKRDFYSGSTCLCRFSRPPHTAKRGPFLFLGRKRGSMEARNGSTDEEPSVPPGFPSFRVSELGERQLLARIRERLGNAAEPPAAVVIGIGDDAA